MARTGPKCSGMETARFICNCGEPFGFPFIWEWAARERAAGRLSTATVSVEVTHPDREGEGSCRWCGCRADETVVVEAES